jgi:hypothetical protein
VIEDTPRRRGRSVDKIVERVKYVDDPPLRRLSPRSEAIYVEGRPWRRRRGPSYDEDYYSYDDLDEEIPRRFVHRVAGYHGD